MTTWQPIDQHLADAIKEARDYFGPEADGWPDDAVVHQLLVRLLDTQRQISELRPHDGSSDSTSGLQTPARS